MTVFMRGRGDTWEGQEEDKEAARILQRPSVSTSMGLHSRDAREVRLKIPGKLKEKLKP